MDGKKRTEHEQEKGTECQSSKKGDGDDRNQQKKCSYTKPKKGWGGEVKGGLSPAWKGH